MPDGALRVLSYGDGPRHVIAVHGQTANASCWRAVARALPAAMHRLAGPVPLPRAPRGMFGELPGLMPEEIAAHWQS